MSSSSATATHQEQEEEIEDLESCELGTKEHWDKAFEAELKNFKDHGLVGEVWFGDDIMMKIVHYIDNSQEIKKTDRIADLGCGNGAMMLELAREGYTELTGLDYSNNAIKMADMLLKSENFSMNFKSFDLLTDHDETETEPFHVCLDKGTFDAISLCPNIPQSAARKKYFENVLKLLRDDGTFILTSCNWTTKELLTFSSQWFTFTGIIPTPSFNFGGKTGNVVSIVILSKKTV